MSGSTQEVKCTHYDDAGHNKVEEGAGDSEHVRGCGVADRLKTMRKAVVEAMQGYFSRTVRTSNGGRMPAKSASCGRRTFAG